MSAADSSPRRDAPSSGARAILVLVVLAVIAAVAFLALWEWQHAKPEAPPASAADVAALRARLAADEAKLAALQAAAQRSAVSDANTDLRIGKLESAGSGEARFDADERRLADLDVRLATVERNAPAADLTQRIGALDAAQGALAARIAKLEANDPAATMRHAAAELALANLVRASAHGPFANELKTFQALMPDAREAAALVSIAPRGAPAQADLARRFPDVAAKALAAERAGEAKGWFGRLWASLTSVVVVRRVGDVKGTDSESILARAGTHLNDGDLAGAVRELDALKGPARAGAEPFLRDAQARLAVDRAVAALAARMAKVLAAP